ncbi:MAG: ATP-dependent DNA helicase RecG [Actinomycetota bacterium]
MTSRDNQTAGRSLAYLMGIPIDLVKGIGTTTAKRLGDAGVASVGQLLLHAPRRYVDRSQLFDLSSVPVGEEVTVGGVASSVTQRRISRGRLMTTATIRDGTSVVKVVWFNPYLKLKEGEEVILSGKAEIYRGQLQMKNPDIDRFATGDELRVGRVVPIHPSIKGFTPLKVRKAVDNALRRSRPITEVLPDDMIERHGLVSRDEAIGNIHFPETEQDAARARDRLIFDELFRLEVALAMRKHRQGQQARGVTHHIDGALVDRFLGDLPFALTGAQERAISEIRSDLGGRHPMHRLLQGEVGSGKTVVALATLLTAVQGGFQGAIMAPTEVLAEQHYLSTVDALEAAGLAPDGGPGATGTGSMFADESESSVRVALLTANRAIANFDGSAGRATVLGWVADGSVDLVIGTHALIQEGVHFSKLGVAVVDEQHRFGVHQRVMLRDKAVDYDPDLLIMTATPIPRTLSMTLYGDLDVSVLGEMPPGRLPAKTRHLRSDLASLDTVRKTVLSEVEAGRQAFVVCPLVEDSDKLEAKSATAEYERLQAVYPDLKLGLLHGQMRPAEKDEVMHRFRGGELDILVATTVIEVGIDIPNATVMVIEDADRFGLSQLHQLRGRVGRGEHQAFCLLVADPSTSDGEERIAAMVATTDGFRLAEEDLRIRGQGTVLGARQSGMTDLRLANILRDIDVLVDARHEAFALVEKDPDLSEHPELATEVQAMLGDDAEWLERS